LANLAGEDDSKFFKCGEFGGGNGGNTLQPYLNLLYYGAEIIFTKSDAERGSLAPAE
jgi:hypothetical protein